MKKIALALLCVWLLALPAGADATGLTVSNPQTDENDVLWYDADSSYNGPGSTTLRILAPSNPAGVSHRFIYVLPVIHDVDLQDFFGDGLEELRALNVHNRYNAHIIAPSFKAEPWYADHASQPDPRYESFIVRDLVPWVRANLSSTGQEEHWLVGFSKSGFGAMTLLFRNPTVFDATAAWDFPADQPDAFEWNMLDNYGTDLNFQDNYRLTYEWIAERKAPFQTTMRLWLSYDEGTYFGIPTFLSEVSAFAGRLQANQVQFLRTGGATREHSWTSGWLPEAMAGLQDMRFSARDDFNRPDGSLGPNWTADPLWGNGGSIAGSQVGAPASTGGAHFWTANSFGADQFSQIRMTGAIGDWVGVSVRGRVSPAQGYWVTIKGDGAYLYSFSNGTFHQLVHDPTNWATGDTLRLEARTVAANVAGLTVYRNGSPLFTHDDASHFLDSGDPGIGLYAGTAIALDDWRGGELNGPPASSSTPPTPPAPRDDFSRADGALGPNWTADPQWGSGGSIAAGQVAAPPFTGGAHFWIATSLEADQYSQIRITGAIGDWVGVSVRGGVSPRQGYWLAVKTDGAYLYSSSNDVFHQLVHDATAWATGDTLRLEVRTVAANVARLTVYRNGSLLFTHDDASHFIGSGYPGIGLYAGTAVALDDWEGGGLSGTPTPPPPTPPAPPVPRDDFNRPDGSLGSNWTADPQWGDGGSIAGSQVAAAPLTGGAYFWTANSFGADQYSQIRITGAIGDWVGVSVRGQVSPAQGYWLAIKTDGAYLYSFSSGAFYQLAHDATIWATGDTLRLEARTIAANAARLTVYRNGSPLFTHDDASHFIDSGYPGIALYAGTAIALDDWEGGGLSGTPTPPPPTPPAPPVPRDDFSRADGALGSNWTADPQWGDGGSIAGSQVAAAPLTGGAYFWTANSFGADQYSQIRITGAIGDWVGVSVRGQVSPAQGYWLAIKTDGAYLYSFSSGAFYQLAHDATIWATGDTLRLEARTIAANVARLTVYRNGSPLFTHDDASHFIDSGYPGIGLYAGTAIALDDWEGATLTGP